MDALMDFSRNKYEHLLQIAQRQHIQMLRAWGGGMPETDDFYELCDKYGILVMQEWPTAGIAITRNRTLSCKKQWKEIPND